MSSKKVSIRRFLVILALAFAPLSPANAILGGDSTSPHFHPYIVALIKNQTPAGLEVKGYTCAGTLIARTWVITTAQCVVDLSKNALSFEVLVGSDYFRGVIAYL